MNTGYVFGANVAGFLRCSNVPAVAPYVPPDRIYKTGIAICTSGHERIDPDYFCEHPWPPYEYASGSGSSGTSGYYITPTAQLVTNASVLGVLTMAHATLEPLWPACTSPCIHRHQITQWGDTLTFPYWTQYL